MKIKVISSNHEYVTDVKSHDGIIKAIEHFESIYDDHAHTVQLVHFKFSVFEYMRDIEYWR